MSADLNSRNDQYDVAVVGAGPAGLAAAVYTSREDLKTVVIDKAVVGGLIATTEIVDNYPGFPDGLGGMELATRLQKHAERFGAKVVTGIEVSGINKNEAGFSLSVASSSIDPVPIMARSILIATGSSYRKLDVPGEKEQAGRGVHYCATCDGPLYRGKTVVAIGGGNSALQEGLFLSKFVGKLIMLVRGSNFRGSPLLVETLTSKPNVEVRFETKVNEIVAKDGLVSTVKIEHNGQTSELPTEGVFPFIGLLPNSTWLGGAAQLDERGFVKVDDRLETSQKGVFAAGDIIQGSVGQVAAAVGEGVSAALSISRYLDPV